MGSVLRSVFCRNWVLSVSLLLIVLQPLPILAATAEKRVMVEGRTLSVPVPDGFKLDKRFGGILSLLGPAQQDGSIPAVFVRSYDVPANGNLEQLMRLVEDRYRRLEGYSRRQRIRDHYIRVERTYHYPESELGIHEVAGYRHENGLLLEVRCVASAMAKNKYHSIFQKVVDNSRFLPGAGENPRQPGADGQTLARIDLAVELVERELWVKAEQVIRPLLERSPKAEELEILLTRSLAGQGRHLEAVTILEHVVGQRPDVLAWHNLLVQELIRGGDVKRAEEHLKKCGRLPGSRSDKAMHLRLQGDFLCLQGNHDKALEAYEKGLALQNTDADLHGKMAACLEVTGRLTEAVIHYREAVNRRTSDRDFRRGLGRVLYHLGEYAAAMYQFIYVSRSQPDDADALTALYHCYRKLGVEGKAGEVFQQLRRLRPSATPEGLPEP